MFTTLRQRLGSKFVLEPDTGCWLWIGAIDGWGYGSVGVNGKAQGAHRVVYEEFTQTKIPDGMELDHLCRVRNCVNPAHLEVVTHRENLLRGNTWVRHAAEQTHCRRGHEFTPENTIRSRHNNYRRRCRICERACRHEAYLRRMAKKRVAA